MPGIAQAVLVKASNADFGVYADKRPLLGVCLNSSMGRFGLWGQQESLVGARNLVWPCPICRVGPVLLRRTWLCEHGLAQILEKLTTAPSLVIFAMTSLLLSVLSLLMNRDLYSSSAIVFFLFNFALCQTGPLRREVRACELLRTLGFTAFEFEAHPYVDVTKEIVLEHERQVSCNGLWLTLKLTLHQDTVAADQPEGVVTHCRPLTYLSP